MSVCRFAFALALFLFIPRFVIAAQPEEPITITLSPRSVTASGVKPGGQVAVLAVARSRNDIGMQIVHWRIVVRDEDGDGVVSVALTEDLAKNSIWAFVDVDSGQTSIAKPEGSRFASIAFPGATLKRNERGELAQFQTGREWVDAILVRPKVGVWSFAGGDGSSMDNDRLPNGKLTFKSSTMQSLLGKESPPPHFKQKDVFIVIDPQRMQYYSTEVSE